MTTNSLTSNPTVANAANWLATAVNAVREHLPADAVVVVEGVAYEPDQLLALVEEVAAPFLEAQRLRIAAVNQHEECVRLLPALRRFHKDLRVGIWAALGRTSGELAHFGFGADRKPARPLTVEEKALRAVRARATRVARGTLGRRQRERIRGDVANVALVAAGGGLRVETSTKPSPSAGPNVPRALPVLDDATLIIDPAPPPPGASERAPPSPDGRTPP